MGLFVDQLLDCPSVRFVLYMSFCVWSYTVFQYISCLMSRGEWFSCGFSWAASNYFHTCISSWLFKQPMTIYCWDNITIWTTIWFGWSSFKFFIYPPCCSSSQWRYIAERGKKIVWQDITYWTTIWFGWSKRIKSFYKIYFSLALLS